MIVVLVVFTGILQIVYNHEGTVLWKPFEQFDFQITTGGVFSAVFIIARIIALILFSSLLTYTTSPTALSDAIERLLSPLKIFKVNVNSLSMMMMSLEIEEAFDIRFEEAVKFVTVGDVCEYLESLNK